MAQAPASERKSSDTSSRTLADAEAGREKVASPVEAAIEEDDEPVLLPPSRRRTTARSTASEKAIFVDWDTPEDNRDANPQSWSQRKKWIALVAVSLFTFVSPLSTTMLAPSSQQLSEKFGIQSEVVLTLINSIFILAYAFGPARVAWRAV